MRRMISTGIIIFCFLAAILVLPCQAAVIELSVDGIDRFFLPGAYLNEQTAMVPLRPMMEAIGAEVDWDAATSRINCQINGHTLSFQVGSRIMYCDQQAVELPSPVAMDETSTFIPLRIPLEKAGSRVTWYDGRIDVDSPLAQPTTGINQPLPELYISANDVGQGQTTLIWLNNALDSDEIIFSTDIPGVDPQMYTCGARWMKIVGIASDTPPGGYIYHLTLERKGIRILDATAPVYIHSGNFEVQHLWVDDSLLSHRDPALAASDELKTDAAFAALTGDPRWDSAFIQPCEGRITTQYGTYRDVNGGEPYQHSGLDIAADYGTPIHAVNTGTVRMADFLNITGNTLIIDHGAGVYSAYCHLDEVYVAPGDWVEKGQAIGTMGSTGFSTGPHLHWNMGVDGIPVSPYGFIGQNPLLAMGM